MELLPASLDSFTLAAGVASILGLAITIYTFRAGKINQRSLDQLRT